MEEIEKKILDYFNDTTKHSIGSKGYFSFKVLDNKYKKYYTGVSLQYICYDLLKAKYRKSDVAKTLYNLYINQKIKCLYCPHVKKYVFGNIAMVYTGLYSEGGLPAYQTRIDYLKQFIINKKI